MKIKVVKGRGEFDVGLKEAVIEFKRGDMIEIYDGKSDIKRSSIISMSMIEGDLNVVMGGFCLRFIQTGQSTLEPIRAKKEEKTKEIIRK